MQIRSPIPRRGALAHAGVALSRAAQVRLGWMSYYQRCRNAARTCRRYGISRQTFYRWKGRWDPQDLSRLEERSRRPQRVRKPTWSAELVERVIHYRQRFPRWGKDKLVVLLRREGRAVSTSMVGRILTRLKAQGRLPESPRRGVPVAAVRRRLRCRPWAERKPKYWRIEHPGDLVQVDTKQVRPARGVLWYHFSARDTVSRWDALAVFPRATALTAAQFLDHLRERMPFPIRALQVDGGSEFAADFEHACQVRQIRLFVLPRCSPKLNGRVERAHRTHNEEFYEMTPDATASFPQLNQQLQHWERIYNTVRPHQALGYLTPQQFLLAHRKEAMCH